MAYTSVVRVHRLDSSIQYILNPGKTEQGLLQSAVGCTCETALEDMRQVKRNWHKEGGVQGYHLVQSFAADELTPELAHRIGMELAEQLLDGEFQVVVATHTNTGHLHNHILWNSVSMTDGRKYRSSYASYITEIRRISDELCQKYGLSVIQGERGEQIGKSYGEWLAEKNRQPTWRTAIRQDIDAAIASALTWSQFLKILARQGYQFQLNRKYITLQPPGKERPVRFKTLGKRYTPEAIQGRILAPKRMRRTWMNPSFGRAKLRGRPVKKLTGLKALYFSYLYKMGILKKKPRRLSFAAREDIRKLDRLLAQLKFVRENGIQSRKQLAELQSEKEAETELLLKRRKMMYRRKAEPSELEAVNDLIREKREIVRMCKQILEQSAKMEVETKTRRIERESCKKPLKAERQAER
ncbi:MAG: relaxase/mobilization nuclease domain-containing protein [Oscillospiraceae bacterium]|jgi:hypothetical protein|nr:relaxase/mobilization nuclease domain-containing protein [Oscillospiraceae bacterium]